MYIKDRIQKKKNKSSRPRAACGIRYLQYSREKVKKDRIKNILQKKWKEEKASYWCTQAQTRKDRERIFCWIL